MSLLAAPLLTSILTDLVCYGELGCFSASPPWRAELRPVPLPQTIEEIGTRFYQYSRQHTRRKYLITWPNISLQGQDFDANKTTFFITHGFANTGNATWIRKLRNAILENVDGNVFVVDWGKGAKDVNYCQAAANIRVVGAEMARFGKYLIDYHGGNPSKFHLVCHSIGSHACSYMAKNISRIGRITALDPAQPLFSGQNRLVRLDKRDADFIDVVHTDAKPFLPYMGFGAMEPIGHVDFYMNGGSNQPGCPPVPTALNITSIKDLSHIKVEAIQNHVMCEQGRAYKYFIAALHHPKCVFWGHKADFKTLSLGMLSGGLNEAYTLKKGDCNLNSCTPIGLITPYYPARGVFVVNTKGNKPYCGQDKKADESMKKLFEDFKSTSAVDDQLSLRGLFDENYGPVSKVESNEFEENTDIYENHKVDENTKINERFKIDENTKLDQNHENDENPRLDENLKYDESSNPGLDENTKLDQNHENDKNPRLDENLKYDESSKPGLDENTKLGQNHENDENPRLDENLKYDESSKPGLDENTKLGQNHENDENPRLDENLKYDESSKPGLDENTKLGQNHENDENPRLDENLKFDESSKPGLDENTEMDENPKLEDNPEIDENPELDENTKRDENPEIDDNFTLDDKSKFDQNQKFNGNYELTENFDFADNPKRYTLIPFYTTPRFKPLFGKLKMSTKGSDRKSKYNQPSKRPELFDEILVQTGLINEHLISLGEVALTEILWKAKARRITIPGLSHILETNILMTEKHLPVDTLFDGVVP